MAASPRFKIFHADGQYEASAKKPIVAVSAALGLGKGATVRDGYKKTQIVWTHPGDGPLCLTTAAERLQIEVDRLDAKRDQIRADRQAAASTS